MLYWTYNARTTFSMCHNVYICIPRQTHKIDKSNSNQSREQVIKTKPSIYAVRSWTTRIQDYIVVILLCSEKLAWTFLFCLIIRVSLQVPTNKRGIYLYNNTQTELRKDITKWLFTGNNMVWRRCARRIYIASGRSAQSTIQQKKWVSHSTNCYA